MTKIFSNEKEVQKHFKEYAKCCEKHAKIKGYTNFSSNFYPSCIYFSDNFHVYTNFYTFA